MACAKGSEPTWQQSFLFSSTEENKSLFTRDVALVIEFFPYESKLFANFESPLKVMPRQTSYSLDNGYIGQKNDILLYCQKYYVFTR